MMATQHSSIGNGKAQFIAPNTSIKQKVGMGGISSHSLDKAERTISNNTTDFKPLAHRYLDEIEFYLDNLDKNADIVFVETVDDLIEPVMQLKANGGMFKFNLLSNIADSCLRYIENLTAPGARDIALLREYHLTMTIIIDNKLKGEGSPEMRKVFIELHKASEFLLSKQS